MFGVAQVLDFLYFIVVLESRGLCRFGRFHDRRGTLRPLPDRWLPVANGAHRVSQGTGIARGSGLLLLLGPLAKVTSVVGAGALGGAEGHPERALLFLSEQVKSVLHVL